MSACTPGGRGASSARKASRRLTKTRRVSRRSRCPICDRADWCLVSKDGTYAICMRVMSSRPARSAMGGWVHPLRGLSLGSVPSYPRPVSNSQTPASVEHRDAVYTALLGRLRLSDGHQEGLRRRGLSEEAIERRGYASLRARGRARVCGELARSFALVGVPGLYVAEWGGRRRWKLAGPPGLLIPARDPRGRILALRIRPDGPRHGKYIWLSSRGRQLGTPCAACCHVVRPCGPVTDRRIWLTEGELKADIASDRLGAVVVSVPGVGSWRRCVEVASALGGHGAGVVVAFDGDARTNRQVAASERELVAALHHRGHTVHRALWPEGLKGLDDALIAGAEVLVRAVNVVIRILPPRRRRRLGPRKTLTVGG